LDADEATVIAIKIYQEYSGIVVAVTSSVASLSLSTPADRPHTLGCRRRSLGWSGRLRALLYRFAVAIETRRPWLSEAVGPVSGSVQPGLDRLAQDLRKSAEFSVT